MLWDEIDVPVDVRRESWDQPAPPTDTGPEAGKEVEVSAPE
jgi:hypothetical protein